MDPACMFSGKVGHELSVCTLDECKRIEVNIWCYYI